MLRGMDESSYPAQKIDPWKNLATSDEVVVRDYVFPKKSEKYFKKNTSSGPTSMMDQNEASTSMVPSYQEDTNEVFPIWKGRKICVPKKWEGCIRPPQAITRNDQPSNSFNTKLKFGYPHSPYTVENIVGGENGVVEGDPKMTKKCSTFLEFFSSKLTHSTPECTIWATLYAVQLGQIWVLGNPLDKLSQFTSTGKGTEVLLLSFGQAFLMFLPAIIWSGMFFMNFIYTTILAWSLPFCVPTISMLVLSLVYYILVLAGSMSGYSILLGSIKMPGLLLVFGGIMGLMLLIGFIIIGVLYAIWCFFLKLEN